jgi:hypothetical protein
MPILVIARDGLHRAPAHPAIGHARREGGFEAARLGGVRRVVYASSLAVSGRQSHFGERPVNEDDPTYAEEG